MPLTERSKTRDLTYQLWVGEGDTWSTDRIQAALLMDLRDRLDVLRCPAFQRIPVLLDQILSELRTARRARERAARRRWLKRVTSKRRAS